MLIAALDLLECPKGPVLEDFPEDVPGQEDALAKTAEGWACPVSFAVHPGEARDAEGLLLALRREITDLRPWYDLGVERKGRTSVAYFAPEAASQLFACLVLGEAPSTPEPIPSVALALRLAAQDLKAFYFESVTAPPGFVLPGASQFNRWFWQETAAGLVLKSVKKICEDSEDEEMRKAAARFLVPLDQA